MHILDATRMLFGEATTVFCRTARVHPDIRVFIRESRRRKAESQGRHNSRGVLKRSLT